jgi:DNA-binding transcriptional MerR regulator
METYLSPVEAARTFGVTAKALRVYEAKGLLSPHRTPAGWRLYGPDEAARVYEILLLQSLGLSLSRIAELSRGRPTDLARTLSVQQAALERRLTQTRKAIRQITKVRERLAADKAVPAPTLVALLREAAVGDHWTDEIERFYAQHLDANDWARLSKPGGADWSALLEELKALSKANTDPASPGAQDFFRRWCDAALAVTTNLETHIHLHDSWRAAAADETTAVQLPLGLQELDYLAALASPTERRSQINPDRGDDGSA